MMANQVNINNQIPQNPNTYKMNMSPNQAFPTNLTPQQQQQYQQQLQQFQHMANMNNLKHQLQMGQMSQSQQNEYLQQLNSQYQLNVLSQSQMANNIKQIQDNQISKDRIKWLQKNVPVGVILKQEQFEIQQINAIQQLFNVDADPSILAYQSQIKGMRRGDNEPFCYYREGLHDYIVCSNASTQQQYKSHPFMFMFDRIERNLLSKDLTTENCDMIFTVYLYGMSYLVTQKYYTVLLSFFKLLREFLNENGYYIQEMFKQPVIQGEVFCVERKTEKICLIAGSFIFDFIPRTQPTFDVNIAVLIFLDFSVWLKKNKLSTIDVRFDFIGKGQ